MQVLHKGFLHWYIPVNGMRISFSGEIHLDLILLGAILLLKLCALRYVTLGFSGIEVLGVDPVGEYPNGSPVFFPFS